jgi:hypothetical protein
MLLLLVEPLPHSKQIWNFLSLFLAFRENWPSLSSYYVCYYEFKWIDQGL